MRIAKKGLEVEDRQEANLTICGASESAAGHQCVRKVGDDADFALL